MTYGHVTTLWSVCCECDAVTRNWVRARQNITEGRAVECVRGAIEFVGFFFHNGRWAVRTI